MQQKTELKRQTQLEKDREKIKNDTENFLKQGGKIEQIKSGVTGYKFSVGKILHKDWDEEK